MSITADRQILTKEIRIAIDNELFEKIKAGHEMIFLQVGSKKKEVLTTARMSYYFKAEIKDV